MNSSQIHHFCPKMARRHRSCSMLRLDINIQHMLWNTMSVIHWQMPQDPLFRQPWEAKMSTVHTVSSCAASFFCCKTLALLGSTRRGKYQTWYPNAVLWFNWHVLIWHAEFSCHITSKVCDAINASWLNVWGEEKNLGWTEKLSFEICFWLDSLGLKYLGGILICSQMAWNSPILWQRSQVRRLLRH